MIRFDISVNLREIDWNRKPEHLGTLFFTFCSWVERKIKRAGKIKKRRVQDEKNEEPVNMSSAVLGECVGTQVLSWERYGLLGEMRLYILEKNIRKAGRFMKSARVVWKGMCCTLDSQTLTRSVTHVAMKRL